MLLAPIITQDTEGFRVSVLRGDRVESYRCETATIAQRFAKFLSQPPTEPRSRRIAAQATTTPSSRANTVAGLVRAALRWNSDG